MLSDCIACHLAGSLVNHYLIGFSVKGSRVEHTRTYLHLIKVVSNIHIVGMLYSAHTVAGASCIAGGIVNPVCLYRSLKASFI